MSLLTCIIEIILETELHRIYFKYRDRKQEKIRDRKYETRNR